MINYELQLSIHKDLIDVFLYQVQLEVERVQICYLTPSESLVEDSDVR